MLEEYKYKTELHAHTTPASACSQITPEYLTEVYKKCGYTSVVLTNHFMYREGEYDPGERIAAYLDDYEKARVFGRRNGINVILGAELRFSENINDYLIYGIEEKDLYTIDSLLSEGVDNFYRVFKNEKNILVQAHPFRDGMERANPKSLDGTEVFNLHPGHNSRIGFAAKYAREHGHIITGGTDYHHFGHEGLGGIFTKEPITDSCQLAAILKSGDYLINISGYKLIP